MKTAISLDAGLLEEADRTARQMGLSRSRLFALALQDYLHSRSRDQMLANLNRVYAGEPDPAALDQIRDGLHLLFDRL
jgi:metal-responsive CopG/Arc/MetJ family transcriptional regulator